MQRGMLLNRKLIENKRKYISAYAVCVRAIKAGEWLSALSSEWSTSGLIKNKVLHTTKLSGL